MKKLFLIFLIFFLLVSLSGCIVFHHKALALDGQSPVVSVELYDLPWMGPWELPEFLSGEDAACKPVKRLSEDRIEDCLAQIRSWVYNDGVLLLPVAQDANREFSGYAVKVTYENGSWEMLEDDLVGWYDGTEMNSKTGGITDEIWDAFLMEFFEVETRSSKAYSD